MGQCASAVHQGMYYEAISPEGKSGLADFPSYKAIMREDLRGNRHIGLALFKEVSTYNQIVKGVLRCY